MKRLAIARSTKMMMLQSPEHRRKHPKLKSGAVVDSQKSEVRERRSANSWLYVSIDSIEWTDSQIIREYMGHEDLYKLPAKKAHR